MSQYLFDNAAPQTAQRFESLQSLYDPITARHLETVGVRAGWRCLEVGGGGGSIAAWLARRVGASGHVLVTDIDPRYLAPLEALGLSSLTIQRHDVEYDPLPSKTFDLIHARLVLSLLPTAEQALRKLVRALAPGGWLVVEDFDHAFLDRTFPTTDQASAALFQKVAAVQAQLLAQHGSPPQWGRGLYQRLRAEGLEDVEMEGQVAVWSGSTAGARLLQANYEQIRGEAVERRLLSEGELEEVLALLEDPRFAFSSMIFFSAWGRCPTG
jgi:ubiquinone/menaquinone biosynthesis C-methylase UbiE